MEHGWRRSYAISRMPKRTKQQKICDWISYVFQGQIKLVTSPFSIGHWAFVSPPSISFSKSAFWPMEKNSLHRFLVGLSRLVTRRNLRSSARELHGPWVSPKQHFLINVLTLCLCDRGDYETWGRKAHKAAVSLKMGTLWLSQMLLNSSSLQYWPLTMAGADENWIPATFGDPHTLHPWTNQTIGRAFMGYIKAI